MKDMVLRSKVPSFGWHFKRSDTVGIWWIVGRDFAELFTEKRRTDGR